MSRTFERVKMYDKKNDIFHYKARNIYSLRLWIIRSSDFILQMKLIEADTRREVEEKIMLKRNFTIIQVKQNSAYVFVVYHMFIMTLSSLCRRGRSRKVKV